MIKCCRDNYAFVTFVDAAAALEAIEGTYMFKPLLYCILIDGYCTKYVAWLFFTQGCCCCCLFVITTLASQPILKKPVVSFEYLVKFFSLVLQKKRI